MSVFAPVVAYSGWIATLISAAYILVQRRQQLDQKSQLDELSGVLARASQQPILVGGETERSAAPWKVSEVREDGIRSALIQAAAGRRTLESVLSRLEESQCDESELLRATEMLRTKGLLEFDAPLTMQSTLRLRV